MRSIRMKLPYAAALSALALGACSRPPSADELRTAMVKDPTILYAVIEAHPDEFLDVLNKAAVKAQGKMREKEQQAEAARIDEEFRHPKVPVIAPGRAILGNPSAPVTIVEYSDFECPYCQHEHPVVAQVLKQYGDRVRLVLKQSPIDFHPRAMPSALMFEAIALQDPAKAYRFYDDVFDHQEQLKADGQKFLEAAAARAGADVPRAVRDMQSDKVKATVQSDMDEARRFGFNGTPGFLINGVSLAGAYPAEEFQKIIDRHLSVAFKS
jgi:protein-disulfide isomerase